MFRPLEPTLETPLYIVWNRCQTFTPIAERFLKQLKESFFNAEQRTPQLNFFAIPLYHSLAERKREKNSMEIRRRSVPAKLIAARAELKTAGAAGRECFKEGIRTLEELAEGEGSMQLTRSH